jgi:C1A family cysteine protease
MKTTFWNLKVLVVCVILVTLFSIRSMASSAELVKIQRAIQARGSEWSVGESWVTQLKPEDRRRLLGEMTLGETPWDQSKQMPSILGVAPVAVDWRDKDGHNWITPIRSQKSCGSCVAFGAVATLESLVRIEQNDPTITIDLSEMHLFSCGGGGCTIGWYNSAASNYLQDIGIPDEECSPYPPYKWNCAALAPSSDPRLVKCTLDPPFQRCADSCPDWQQRVYKINDYGRIKGIETCKKYTAIAPILVSFKVYTDFYYYAGGIYQRTWGDYEGGHAVSIVGYDTTGPVDYWIVKNSWGNGWGESGYCRIKMGECNIENRGSYWMVGANSKELCMDYWSEWEGYNCYDNKPIERRTYYQAKVTNGQCQYVASKTEKRMGRPCIIPAVCRNGSCFEDDTWLNP